MQVFNTRTQQEENVVWSTDKANDLIATFEDETFVKFPAGLTLEEVQEFVNKHRDANEAQEVITPEMEAEMAEQQEANEKLLEQLNGNTMPEGDTTNASQDDTSS